LSSLSSSSSSLSPLLCTHQWATGARVLSSQWKRSEIDWLFERARTAKKTFKFKKTKTKKYKKRPRALARPAAQILKKEEYNKRKEKKNIYQEKW
jgi:hypothetical protein